MSTTARVCPVEERLLNSSSVWQLSCCLGAQRAVIAYNSPFKRSRHVLYIGSEIHPKEIIYDHVVFSLNHR